MSDKTKFWLFVAVIFILILSFVVMESQAQAGDGIQFTFTCRTESAIRFRISVPSNVLYVLVGAGNYPLLPTQYIKWLGEKQALYRSEVPRGSGYLVVHSQVGAQDFHYNVAIPSPLIDCADYHFVRFPIPEGLECLGLPYPGQGYFVVDGNEYFYDNSLGFVVPFDAIWRWELFINGELILVFEQTEYGNCRVTEDYRP